MTGEWGSRLWTFPASVMRDLWGTLGAGGRGCWGPNIAVSCTACTVGGAGTTAQWRVLEQQQQQKKDHKRRGHEIGNRFKMCDKTL